MEHITNAETDLLYTAFICLYDVRSELETDLEKDPFVPARSKITIENTLKNLKKEVGNHSMVALRFRLSPKVNQELNSLALQIKELVSVLSLKIFEIEFRDCLQKTAQNYHR